MQDTGLVPIVEPEILLDGSHGIDTTLQVAEKVWSKVFYFLAENNVMFEGILLKPSMVTPGAECPERATPEQVAEYTLKMLRRRVPPAVPGIMVSLGDHSHDCNLKPGGFVMSGQLDVLSAGMLADYVVADDAVLVWRPVGGGSHSEPERNEPEPEPMACIVLVRPRPSELCAEDVERATREFGGREEGFAGACEGELVGTAGQVLG